MENNQITIESMICYFIEANKTITDSKDKLLRNCILAVRKELETKNDFNIKDKINIMEFNNYFNPVTDKWIKINRKLVVNYAALVFDRLLNYRDFKNIDIIKNSKFIIDKYVSADENQVLEDSCSLLSKI